MIALLDLRQALDAFAACNDDHDAWASFGWVHVTEGDLMAARFWLPADEDTAFDEDGEVPADAQALDLSAYLEPATFADVLDVQKRQRPLSSLQDYAQALMHYAEYDAFLEVEGVDEALGEAGAAEQDAARAGGVGPGIFAAFELTLAGCADGQINATAQRVAHLFDIPVGQALARCRALPLVLGAALDRRRAQAIKDDFADIGVSLQVRGYKPFPWMHAPALR
ncbi:hypothetical protein KQ945_02260 [Bacillus subtilis subsp. subtilis]|nr:hypothetical protein [Bacillus subtilis subsp. subtilis]